jgi:lipocalin
MAVVKNFDILAYLGVWQEIASLPQIWKKMYADGASSCAGASAVYSLSKASTSTNPVIQIYNVCYNNQGNVTGSIIGHAVCMFDTEVGWLRVTFNPFMPNLAINKFGSDYLIHATDYLNYSMVGTRNRTALWILARPDTHISRHVYDELINTAKKLDYPVDKLQMAKIRI